MKIRKISNRSTSLTVSASVTQAGTYKAVTLTNTLAKKIENFTASLIPKAHVVISRVVDHILLNREFEPINYFSDYVSIISRPALNFGKTLQSNNLLVTESITLSLDQSFRPFRDSINTDELIAFLLDSKRTFDLAVNVDSRPALLFAHPETDDIASLDLIRLARLNTVAPDNIVLSDDLSRLITVFRTIDDDVGMLDYFTTIDGSTYSLDRTIREFVSVGGSALVEGFRTSGNEYESIEFFIHKVLDPDIEYLDSIYLNLLKGVSDEQYLADVKSLLLDKFSTDLAHTSDQSSTIAGKGLRSELSIDAALLRFYVEKALADSTTMIDNMDLGDDLTYESSKLIADFLTASEQKSLLLLHATLEQDLQATDLFAQLINKQFDDVTAMLDSLDLGDRLLYESDKLLSELLPITESKNFFVHKVRTDTLAVDELIAKLISLADPNENLAVADQSSLTPGKNIFDSVLSIDELISLVRPKNYADSFNVGDANTLYNIKAFADAVIADDPLVRLADGIVSYVLLNKSEAVSPTDFFNRTFTFYRWPHHGFGDFTPIDDNSPNSPYPKRLFKLDAKTSVYINRPIVRINKIFFSEEMGNPYWGKAGTYFSSNATIQPPTVYPDTSIIYDSAYDATQVMELFDGYQYNSPYGLQWYREVKLNRETIASSRPELLIEDTSAGEHSIEATASADLVDLQRFSYSVYVKYVGRRYMSISVGGEFEAKFDLVKGKVLSFNSDHASCYYAGDGWWLCQIASILPVTEVNVPYELLALDILLNSPDNPRAIQRLALTPPARTSEIKISALTDNLEANYIGTGTQCFYIWGSQLEVGDQALQEVSSLNYIRTQGGNNSKLGYNQMPDDRDRVFVGTYLRNRDIYTRRHSGDPYENFSVWLDKNAPQGAIKTVSGNTITAPGVDTVFAGQQYQGTGSNALFSYDPLERKAIWFDKTTKQGNDVVRTVSGNTVTAADTDRVFVGQQYGRNIYSYDPMERKSIWFDKVAKRADTSIITAIQWDRINYVLYSESFDRVEWIKIGVTAPVRGLANTSGDLPFRSTTWDANRLIEELEYTPYTYYKQRWFDYVPLSNLPDYTSTVVTDIYENPVLSEHAIQTQIFNNNQDDDLLHYSLYASPTGGVYRFRLLVNNNRYVDFDLSSGTIVTSTGVLYESIQLIDSNPETYLCRLVCFGERIRELLLFKFIDDFATPVDVLTLRHNPVARTFDLATSVSEEHIIATVYDYNIQSGAEDFETDTGSIDYAVDY